MKSEWEVLQETGVLGAYDPGIALLRREDNNDGIVTLFRDARCTVAEDEMTEDRVMLIGGRSFHITSVFPAEESSTPTEKMLTLIGRDLKNKP